MKLSTKGRYGLMAMYRLKLNYGSGPMPISDIAKLEQLSESYLEQLFTQLKKNDLVKSVRGAGGGYELTRDPNEIKIGQILKALEGDMALSCASMSTKPECRNGSSCATKGILDKLQNKMEKVLDSMSLADM